MMPSSADRVAEPKPLYSMHDLRAIRRDVLLYARSFPAGAERNQHRQIARSLRNLFRNRQWLETHTVDGTE